MLPIPVLDASQAAAWDERARVEARIPSRVLMETAGRAVARVMVDVFHDRVRDGVVVAAGHGNNGGDGWVVARALAAVGIPVAVAESERDRSADCRANRELALSAGVPVIGAGDAWPAAPLVVDALLGTGATGAPRDDIAALADRVAGHAGPVVAVDGPTGLNLSTGEAHGPVRASLTVTFGGPRRGHLLARAWCGRLVTVDIGFPPADPTWPWLCTDREAAALLPALDPDMHKGSRGRVLVIGGAAGMAGAAMHASTAAFGAGAGLVRVAAHGASVEAAQAQLPDALSLVSALGPDVEPELSEALDWADAVVLGPGLGRGDDRSRFVAAVLERAGAPVVVDADALHAGPIDAGAAPRVLTPHVGEFRAAFPALADAVDADRFAAVERAAGEAAPTTAVLLKGVPTVVAQRDAPLWVVAAGNPGLATGGSGDLLSGFVAAYLARGLAPNDAAALGAWTLGRAADVAAAQHTARAVRPADVLAALPDVWRAIAAPPGVALPMLDDLQPPTVV
jgi:NAD(P)H-hydrate epimerase